MNDLTRPKVNLLKNIPMSDKQRTQLIYQFLRKVVPGLPLRDQMSAADSLLVLWKATPQDSLDEIWDYYVSPRKTETRSNDREEQPARQEDSEDSEDEDEDEDESTESNDHHESFSLDINLNDRQRLAVDFAKSGKSFVLTGAAGTGKTTTEREIVKTLLAAGNLGEHEFKDKRSGRHYKLPGIAVVSFTNKAANTSRKAIHKDPDLELALPHNITTIHNLLEFMPIFFDREDGSQGMRFEPQRNEFNPLDCRVIIVEEASTVGAFDLYQHLYRAIRPGTTLIFVGDINQLPPIFSPSILNYALVQLPVVELVEIYRQAQDSPIISNAHRILSGQKLEESRPHFTVISGKKLDKVPGGSFCVQRLINSLKNWSLAKDPSANGEMMYDPDQDIILSPYNKSDCGTTEINNHVAQFLGIRRGAEVHHIIAGIHQHYLAVGDRVFSFKKEAVITKISKNAKYVGKSPKVPGIDLTRWGVRVHSGAAAAESHEDFELMMEGYENMNVDDIPDQEEMGKKQAASHIVDIKYVDDDSPDTLETAGDFGQAGFSLGYALTCHKAQGSEWRKVFILVHKNQIAHLFREWLYTAVTRARTHTMLIDFTDISDRIIAQQRIKGNSINEKIAWFNSEISLKEPILVLKPETTKREEYKRWETE